MRILPFADDRAQAAALPDVVEHLRSGGLILYPTETVFGFGGLTAHAPTEALSRLKARDPAKPFILLVDDPSLTDGLAWSPAANALAKAFWPGPLTLILRDELGRYPRGVASESGAVAVRETPHAGVRRLLAALGEPITSTSANAAGTAPARTADEARTLMRDLPRRANVWMLDGAAGGAPPSSIVDCTGAHPRLVRAGAVPAGRIREIVDDLEA